MFFVFVLVTGFSLAPVSVSAGDKEVEKESFEIAFHGGNSQGRGQGIPPRIRQKLHDLFEKLIARGHFPHPNPFPVSPS